MISLLRKIFLPKYHKNHCYCLKSSKTLTKKARFKQYVRLTLQYKQQVLGSTRFDETIQIRVHQWKHFATLLANVFIFRVTFLLFVDQQAEFRFVRDSSLSAAKPTKIPHASKRF